MPGVIANRVGETFTTDAALRVAYPSAETFVVTLTNAHLALPQKSKTYAIRTVGIKTTARRWGALKVIAHIRRTAILIRDAKIVGVGTPIFRANGL